ncbi:MULTISPECIES: GNAT family N-acetyltransferase [unclassified Oceanobacillus]|uniref:GNAT family N-acetyltransferase n=1 Tax=unclassified Oceanobacillus TaxID=2630292 RepID=UPI0012EC36B5|nr:GNAT family N-acetyltransferase [Oceanobacillus sp. AG]
MAVTGDNIKAWVRTGKLEDAQALLNIQKEVVAENEYLITVSKEFGNTLKDQIQWMKRILENERETILVAEIEGKIIGWLVIQSPKRKRLLHTGSFGMMIQKDYRGLGIGKALINELLRWAERNPLIEKVSLGVFSTNIRAISLYKSMGFVEEGRKIKEIKLNETEYVDDILMYKLV